MKAPFLLSVVIPTHNRRATLARALEALSRQQTLESAFEVVVVDDGSTDATPEYLRDCSRHAHPFAWSWRRQERGGQGAARNLGCTLARGQRVLFLGDDILPTTTLIGEHQRAGADPALAILGYTCWHPEIRATPFRTLLNEDGLQFGYRLLVDGGQADFRFFYTSNLSLDRQRVLDAGGFDAEFSGYGWEDIELGYRMTRAGLRIQYRPAARAHHLHAVSPASFARRQLASGQAALKLLLKHPTREIAELLEIDRALAPPAPAERWLRLAEPLLFAFEPLGGGLLLRALNRSMVSHYRRGLRAALREHARQRGLEPAALVGQVLRG